MPLIELSLDAEEDVKNIWETANLPLKYEVDFSNNLPLDLKELSKKNNFEEVKDKLGDKQRPIYNSNITKIFTKTLNESWVGLEKDYISRIEKITGKKVKTDKIIGYLTTIKRCKYNPEKRIFTLYLFSGLFESMKLISHEVFHIHFHDYFFDELSNKLGKEKAHDIKEALTILLNIECKDLWFVEDKGYDKHRVLREKISEFWNKNKNFEELLEYCKKCLEDERRL